MPRSVLIPCLAGLAFAGVCTAATASDLVLTERTPRVEATFAPTMAVAVPGSTVPVVLHQRIAPGWHTYWENPGDSGKEITVVWSLPEGVTAGRLRFPVPEAIPVGPLMNYGYQTETTLVADLSIPRAWPAGQPVRGEARASWVVCEEICIPEGVRFSFSLPTGTGSVPLEEIADLFSRASKAFPVETPWPVTVHQRDDTLLLVVDGDPGGGTLEGAYFFPREWGRVEHAAPQRPHPVPGCAALVLARGELPPPARLEGVLVLPGDSVPGYLVSATVRPPGDDADSSCSEPYAAVSFQHGGLTK